MAVASIDDMFQTVGISRNYSSGCLRGEERMEVECWLVWFAGLRAVFGHGQSKYPKARQYLAGTLADGCVARRLVLALGAA